jgi:hypothetical protein
MGELRSKTTQGLEDPHKICTSLDDLLFQTDPEETGSRIETSLNDKCRTPEKWEDFNGTLPNFSARSKGT